MNESKKTKALAQFNKLNGKFTTVIGMVDDVSLLNHNFYNYRQVEIDLYNETVIGTYDSFQIVNVNEGNLQINEDMLKELARDKIVKEYPIERQLTILGKTLKKIADSVTLEDIDELREMNDYIDEIKRVNSIRKEFYKNNPDYDYMSTEDLDRMINEKYEGSIQAYDGQFTSL
jgi:hypothetical protein